MKTASLISLSFVLGFATLTASPAAAEIVVQDVWVRATAGAGKVTAGYGIIRNTGDEEDHLLSVGTPVAGMAHIHQSSRESGIMKMDPVDQLTIPAGGEVALAPGATYHFMLMNLSQPLKVGETIELLLTFKNAGPVKATATVQPLSAQKPHH